MIIKWVLVIFAVATLGLLLVAKVVGFLHPPRPGRPEPPVMPRLRRALRWTIGLPLAVGLALLAAALLAGP